MKTLAYRWAPWTVGVVLLTGLSVGAPSLVTAAPAAASAAANPANPSSSSDIAGQAAFQFALAKSLLAEGSYGEALAAFEEAEKLAPEDPYIRIEHAELLAGQGLGARTPRARAEALGRAVDQVKKARALAPNNPDVLRAVGEIHLAVSDQDAGALDTAREAYEALRRQNPADLQVMVTLGRILLEQSQPAKAAEVFRELVSYVPNNQMANTLLVESLLKADRKPEAETVLRELLAADPDALQARLTLAEVQGQRGDHRGALETLSAAPEALRKDPQLRRQLASALYLTGDLDAALQTADELLAAQPGNQYLDLLKGLILTAQGRNEEALTLLTRLRESDPQDLVLAATLSRVLRREGQKDAAAKLLGDLAADLAKDGKGKEAREATLELAQLYATTEDWQKESETVEPLLRADDPALRSEAMIFKADALVELKRFDEALAVLGEKSVPPGLAAKRAEVLWKAGKTGKARRELAHLARAGDAQALLAAAQAYQRLEQYRDSVPLLVKALSAHPELPAAGFLLAAAYERSGQRDLAVSTFRGLLKTAPDFHAALNYLGYMWAEKGENLEEALTLIRRAVALDPDNGAYVDSLGWAHYRLGQFDRARKYLERATRLVPEDATVHEHLGDVYVALGDRDRAREMYRRALALGDRNGELLQRKLTGLDAGGPNR